MRVISDYLIQKTGEEYTMLPYGQAVARHLPELRLNRTGVRIYRLLQEGLRGRELTEAIAEGEDLDDEAMESLTKDVDSFISYLRSHGVITDDTLIPDIEADACFHIAGIPVYYYGDRLLIDDKLWAFTDDKRAGVRSGGDGTSDDRAGDAWIDDEIAGAGIPPLRISVQTTFPRALSTGNILIRTGELVISEDEGSYHIVYLSYRFVRELHMAKRTGDAVICVTMGENSHTGAARTLCAADECAADEGAADDAGGLSASDEVFYAMRTAFLLYAARFGRFALHSSSIVYRDRVYCFSAASGTGKSTHTALWHTLYGTPVSNGDLNLISIEGDRAYVYGIPWCGTSGQYETADRELGGIVILERGREDEAERLTPAEAARLVRMRLITPAWEESMLYRNMQFAGELCGSIPVARLRCTPSESAARVMKEEIDRWAI